MGRDRVEVRRLSCPGALRRGATRSAGQLPAPRRSRLPGFDDRLSRGSRKAPGAPSILLGPSGPSARRLA